MMVCVIPWIAADESAHHTKHSILPFPPDSDRFKKSSYGSHQTIRPTGMGVLLLIIPCGLSDESMLIVGEEHGWGTVPDPEREHMHYVILTNFWELKQSQPVPTTAKLIG